MNSQSDSSNVQPTAPLLEQNAAAIPALDFSAFDGADNVEVEGSLPKSPNKITSLDFGDLLVGYEASDLVNLSTGNCKCFKMLSNKLNLTLSEVLNGIGLELWCGEEVADLLKDSAVNAVTAPTPQENAGHPWKAWVNNQGTLQGAQPDSSIEMLQPVASGSGLQAPVIQQASLLDMLDNGTLTKQATEKQGLFSFVEQGLKLEVETAITPVSPKWDPEFNALVFDALAHEGLETEQAIASTPVSTVPKPFSNAPLKVRAALKKRLFAEAFVSDLTAPRKARAALKQRLFRESYFSGPQKKKAKVVELIDISGAQNPKLKEDSESWDPLYETLDLEFATYDFDYEN